VQILSTCKIRESTPDDWSFFDGLTSFSAAGIQPKLEKSSTKIKLPADHWWEQHVISLENGLKLSRKNIALDAANKDGGAHVDAELPQHYLKLIDGLFIDSIGGGPFINHQFPALRQMGYEVLNSTELRVIANYTDQTDSLKKAVPPREKMFVTDFQARSIPPEEKQKLLEDLARRSPILVPSNGICYASLCPICHSKVEGEFPLTQEEKWIYCDKGDLLLIQRNRA